MSTFISYTKAISTVGSLVLKIFLQKLVDVHYKKQIKSFSTILF